MVLQRISQSLRVSMAFIIAVFSTGLLPSAVAYAGQPAGVGNNNTNTPGPEPKVFVCKYVGTPGVSETLQTGNNPVSVSSSSTGNTAVNSSFTDNQGRSFVLKIDDTPSGPEGDPNVSECPPPTASVVTSPIAPVSTDPCNPVDVTSNIAWTSTLPAGTANIVWSESNNGATRTATLIGTNVKWSDNTTAPKVFNLPADSGVACTTTTTVTIPTAPASTDPCNTAGVTNNVAWASAIPMDTANIDWSESNSGATRTATLIGTNVKWSDNTTAPKVFNLPADSGVACERFVFVCKYVGTPGINETLQTGGNPIRVSVSAIPAGAQVGAEFADRQGRSVVLEFDTGQPEPSIAACQAPTPNLIQPPTIPVNDPCGANNATFGTVPTSNNYSFVENRDGSVTFTANTGFRFNSGTTVRVPAPTETNTQACPAGPCTVSNNSFMAPWTYGGEAYPFADEGGSYEFKSDGLYLNTPTVDAYVYGFVDGGNTKLSDVDAMSYKTLRLVQSAGFEGTLPAYILLVDTNGTATAGGEKYMFYEPYNNGTVTEGTWQTWDAYSGGDAKWYISGTGQTLRTWDYFVNDMPDAVVLAYGFNQGSSNAETFTAIQDMTFNCATTTFGMSGGGRVLSQQFDGGGQGGGSGSVLGAAKSAALPAVLPATGTNDSLFTIITASLLAYGAAYFLQGRRLLARREA